MNWSVATYLVWGALAVVALVNEFLSRRFRSSHLAIVDVLRAVRSNRVGQVALALAWMWVGWHVFAR